jgi:hypothetical protein
MSEIDPDNILSLFSLNTKLCVTTVFTKEHFVVDNFPESTAKQDNLTLQA